MSLQVFNRKPRILIVDDERTICESLEQVLRDENCETKTVTSGTAALAEIPGFKPDLMFLDIWMPGLDGLDTLDRVRESNAKIQVIMISGHATIQNALDATKRGAFDFIEKPLNIDGILQSASRALKLLESGDDSVIEHSQASSHFSHFGMLSKNLPGKNLGQRSLKKSTVLYGLGLHSGQKSGLSLEPLPKDSGIHFGKIGTTRTVPAFVDFVDSTAFATSIRHDDISVATIEHLLAALHAYRISNLLIKCNDEVPILDGSAIDFCKVIEEIGIQEQGGDWYELAPTKSISFVASAGCAETITIEPAEKFSVNYELNYPDPVGHQSVEFVFDSVAAFKEKIAPARTFGFVKDIERLQRAGLAAGGRFNNFILIGSDNIINTELRFPDELARHKILDIIGDIFLTGRPIRGRVRAKMTGHSDNISLLKNIWNLASS
ncbi:UDP-3-O-[3-hydroxymyristoyl] N-acetylglucosamine deacetylase [bacterium]|nr:UDP-3-O-[3-hydroxymyristoyl] N-acetylglucosamine deacetylase [bacterium]